MNPVTFVLLLANGAPVITHVACKACMVDASNPDDGPATYMKTITLPPDTLDFWFHINEHLVEHADADQTLVMFEFATARQGS